MDLKSLKTNGRYITVLNANWIRNVEDLFNYFPRTYEDRSKIRKLNEVLIDWSIQLVKWKMISKNVIKTPTWKTLVECVFEDSWWNKWLIQYLNATYILRELKLNSWYIITWKPKFDKWRFIFWHPELISTEEDWESQWFNIGQIYPIYSELNWIKPNWFAKKIRENLDKIDNLFEETYPKDFLNEFNLLDIKSTIKNMHYPESFWILERCKFRVFFERLLRIQMISMLNKLDYQNASENIDNWKWEPDREVIKDIISKISFELTWAQKRSLKQVIDDFHKTKPMLRLMQWDVWSWKTIVAAIAWYYTIQKLWGQVAFLAPTEVLANQQFRNIAKLFLPLGIRVEVITWSMSSWQKQKVKEDLKNWNIQIIIWTHALIQEDIDFKDLKFVIIDEQHKFWVMQRWFFKKFWSPNILQMTATPIPRSLTLAFFGEFDVSIIDELPAGRKPIHTKIINEQEFYKYKDWYLTKINQWQSIYIVTPLIEESEKLDEVKSATGEYQDICNFLPEIWDQIWLLHWKMKAKDKDEVMNKFKNWQLKVLVSTTVIEVWIDVPHATIIVIKNAERFGLSQLHQLRWRVWRSDLISYCFLVTKSKSWPTYQRLKAMELHHDWFKLAELDLQQRWSWEILWTRQSWDTDIPLEIITDIKFLEKVQQAAIWLLEKYPNLKWLEKLKENILNKEKNILV